MPDMWIRDVPKPLKREIEIAACKAGKSVSDMAIDLLRKGIVAGRGIWPGPNLSAWDAIRSAFAAESAIDDEFAKIMGNIEAARKRDYGH